MTVAKIFTQNLVVLIYMLKAKRVLPLTKNKVIIYNGKIRPLFDFRLKYF